MISEILQAIQNNFGILWPLYFAQFGFEGTAPTIPFFFRPRFKSFQGAAPQIVVFPTDEPLEGPEIHQASTLGPQAGNPSNAVPRQLWRHWTRLIFYLWGSPSVLPQWSASVVQVALDPISPTVSNQNGLWFQCTTPGTTGATEPSWPAAAGDTVTDGTAVWTCVGPVDDYRVLDTDMTDLMRTVMIGALHYTLVGEWKPLSATWYDANDDLLMSGTVNRLTVAVLIPVPDVAPPVATIQSVSISTQVNILVRPS